MARDLRFVDVFDFKSFLTSRQREGSRVRCCILIPSVYWPYIMKQHRRAIAAFAGADVPEMRRTAGRDQARRGAARSSQQSRIRFGWRVIQMKIQWLMRDIAVRTLPLGHRSAAQKSCPCLRAPTWTADRWPSGRVLTAMS